jgi:hypothetical protein
LRGYQDLNWQEEKEKRAKEALERHRRLSNLFRENPFAFELERKKMIEEVIAGVDEAGQRKRLRALQGRWDKRMKGAGSSYNRFVLAKMLFWDHFNQDWHPAIQKLNARLKIID